eukprot:TRINITY_DN2795_c0_g1_i13.p1 TRINITY_DN2795_c0_g1~~TRINITY_DN2795_c0_g1_i13.p1  ORF type:complete len:664 (-),score=91.21 TRINITY_DN2795_c0_g1_i13:320-2311(-)
MYRHGMQERRDAMPRLELHPIHNAVTPKSRFSALSLLPKSQPSALSLREIQRAVGVSHVQEESMPDIEFAARLALRCASLRDGSESPIAVQLDVGCLRITFKQVKITIPLVMSEVFCLQDGKKCVLSVLVRDVSRAAPLSCKQGYSAVENSKLGAGIWLFSASGSQSGLSSLMDAWSRMGAIRNDLLENYVVDKDILGSGGFAVVYTGRPRRSQSESSVAVKLSTGNNEAMVMQEVGAMLAVQGHSSVLGFKGLFRHMRSAKSGDEGQGRSGVQWALVLEYCPNGDLFDHLHRAPGSRLTDADAKPLIGGILSGLAQIHQAGIIHRDMKPENILLAEGNRPVISDFGIAIRADDEASKAKVSGSPGYFAPEVLRGNSYGTNSDIFGVGCIAYQLLKGYGPFHDSTPTKMLAKNKKAEVCFRSRKLRDATDFLAELLAEDPELRPSASRALCNSWLRGAAALAQDEEHASPKDEAGMLEMPVFDSKEHGAKGEVAQGPIMRWLRAKFPRSPFSATSEPILSSIGSDTARASGDKPTHVREPFAPRPALSARTSRRNLRGRSRWPAASSESQAASEIYHVTSPGLPSVENLDTPMCLQILPSEPSSPATPSPCNSSSCRHTPFNQEPMPLRALDPCFSDASSSPFRRSQVSGNLRRDPLHAFCSS